MTNLLVYQKVDTPITYNQYSMTDPEEATALSTAYVLNDQMAKKKEYSLDTSSLGRTLRIFLLHVDLCRIHVNIFLVYFPDVYTN